MPNEQYIRCPDCGTPIPFDPRALVRGDRFACPQCLNVSIGIDSGSRRKVEETLDELQNVKRKLGRSRPDRPTT